MPFQKILSLAASTFFLAVFVSAGDQCYYLNGQPAGGVYRCDNTTSGESSCCNAGQVCYSNGVCQAGPQDHATDWLRVGCTDKTWSSPACLKQCTSLVPDSSAGVRPCGGILSSDQYCCDTQGQGPGSLACCSNSSNIFTVDPIATIIATIPLNPTNLASSSSATPAANSSNILVPTSTASSTVTITSGSTTATTYASSAIPSSSYYFISSNSTSTSAASSTSTPSSIATKSAVPAVTTSSLASRFGTAGMGVSFGIAMLAGLVYVL